MKREKEMIEQMNVDHLSEDKGIIYQVQHSREDRAQGLDFLQRKIKGFESEQDL